MTLKLSELQEYLKDMADIFVNPATISRWENKGLLGVVPMVKGGQMKDYETLKERMFVITVLRNYAGWREAKVRNLFKMPPQESKELIEKAIDTVEIKVMPRFKSMVAGQWEQIVRVVEENANVPEVSKE